MVSLEKILKIGKRILQAGVLSLVFYGCDNCPSMPPKPEPPQETELSENTQILPEEHLKEISSVEEDSITFLTPVPYVTGDIIVGETSDITLDGFIRKVEYVSLDKKTIYTLPASLEEAVKNGEFEFNGVLSPADTLSSMSIEGVSQMLPKSIGFNFGVDLDNVVLWDVDGNLSTTEDQVIADGNIYFNSNLIFGLKVRDFQLDEFLFKNVISAESELRIRTSEFLENLNKDVKIIEYKFPPFTAGYIPTVPPLPIRIRPRLDLYVHLNGDISSIEVKVSQGVTLTAGLSYENEDWNIISELLNEYNFDVSNPQGISNFKASVGPRLNLFLYGILGPYGEVNKALQFQSDEESHSWKLYGGLEANLGVKMEIFSHTLMDYSRSIVDFDKNKKLLAEGELEGEPPEVETMIDQRDGQIYNIVQIGNQTWMAENLNYDYLGSEFYDNNSSYEEVYGRLYDWGSSKIVCPSGWDLPTYDEWETLFDFLGGKNYPGTGGKMKDTGTIEAGTGLWYSPNSGATNESGFTALPGGRKEDGNYAKKDYSSYFWVDTSPYGFTYSFFYDTSYAGSYTYLGNPEGMYYCVRCIKD